MLDSQKFDEWVAEQLIQDRNDDKLDKEILELVRSYYVPGTERDGTPLIGLDIDGTLTYSHARMNLRDKDFTDPLYVTEILEGKPFCFMTEKANRIFNVLRRNAYVVPVTSRGIKQFSRINLFKDNTEFSVLNTGGKILVNGEMDTSWSEFIENKTSYDISPPHDVEQVFLAFSHQPWFKQMSHLRSDLVQMKMDPYTMVPEAVVEEIRTIVEGMGWQLSAQGKKLFAIPGFLSKRLGFEEVMARVEADYTMTAGDSTLDIPLLEAGTYAFRPDHGELATHDYRADNLVITDHKGIVAGEEILARMLAVIVASNC